MLATRQGISTEAVIKDLITRTYPYEGSVLSGIQGVTTFRALQSRRREKSKQSNHSAAQIWRYWHVGPIKESYRKPCWWWRYRRLGPEGNFQGLRHVRSVSWREKDRNSYLKASWSIWWPYTIRVGQQFQHI